MNFNGNTYYLLWIYFSLGSIDQGGHLEDQIFGWTIIPMSFHVESQIFEKTYVEIKIYNKFSCNQGFSSHIKLTSHSNMKWNCESLQQMINLSFTTK
jgi:hypothetical protein